MSKHIGYALTLTLLLLVPFTNLLSQTLLWSANYGGSYNDMGQACQIMDNKEIMILGSSFSYGAGSSDIYLIKTDEFGNSLWSKQFGSDSTDYGYDIQKTSDGGFIIVGSSRTATAKDVYLIKIDSIGIIEWEKIIGGTGNEEGRSVRQTADNGYIIGGTTNSIGSGYNDMFLVKTDSLGNVTWQKAYGGAGGETGYAARQTADSGYVMIGSTGSFGAGYSSVYLVRTDKNGDTLWTNTFGGNSADLGYSVEISNDGGFILSGATASFGAGEYDAYLIKTDPNGNLEWENSYGGSEDDRGYSVKETLSGNFVLTGKTSSFTSNIEAYLVMTNPIGDIIWDSHFGGLKTDEAQAVVFDDEHNIFVVGRSFSYSSGGSDIYLLKIQGDQATDINAPIHAALPDGFALEQNYPNPFNLSTSIEYSIPFRSDISISIYNILGQQVSAWHQRSLPAGTYRYEWDGRSESGNVIASGIYLYRLEAGIYSQTKKMVLLK